MNGLYCIKRASTINVAGCQYDANRGLTIPREATTSYSLSGLNYKIDKALGFGDEMAPRDMEF